MPWQEIHRRLLGGLLDELRNHWGRIREVEERLGISTAGYLNKMCSGRAEIRLRVFLEAIEALGMDHQRFFARVLEIRPRSEDYLIEIEDPSEVDKALAGIAKMALEIEAVEPPPAEPQASADAASVARFVRGSREAQQRALGHTKAYRNHAFVDAYLKHLDAHRYDHAEEAARLATGVVKDLLPRLPGPRRDRLSLLCRALGIFGSARRLKGRFTSASKAFRLALEIADRARLQEDSANLLIRASYLLKDHGHFERALGLLNEALVLFVRLGSQRDMGRVLVDQGMMSCCLGDYRTAVLDLEQALIHLDGSAEDLPRSRLAAYQFLAYAFEQSGDLDTAESWLARGVRALGSGHAVDRARLQWSRGTLALRRGEPRRAEDWLRSVRTVLAKHENTLKEAIVTLDLLRALLAQGKNLEATETAVGMGQLMWKFKNNQLAEATVLELVNAALAGQLDDTLVRQVRAKLDEPRTTAPDITQRSLTMRLDERTGG